jgi:hypothetical protein
MEIINGFSEKDIHSMNDYRSLALVYAYSGDTDKAFEYLDKGWSRRDISMSTLKIDPKFDLLRGDPRFQALIEKMKFPE